METERNEKNLDVWLAEREGARAARESVDETIARLKATLPRVAELGDLVTAMPKDAIESVTGIVVKLDRQRELLIVRDRWDESICRRESAIVQKKASER